MPSENYAFTREELETILPVILSDLKHASDPAKRTPTNSNIREQLYKHVIRELYGESRFKQITEDNGQGHLFIRGYVRDVWAYLEDAYDLIHSTNFEKT